jgi:hypothetical protein
MNKMEMGEQDATMGSSDKELSTLTHKLLFSYTQSRLMYHIQNCISMLLRRVHSRTIY